MGTSLKLYAVKYLCQDHPHAYGDKSYNYAPYPHIQGSSPRVWGQESECIIIPTAFRIIPTRMGTRPRCLLPWSRMRDHPHAYGDKIFLMYLLMRVIGSSPRVWGQAEMRAIENTEGRIIPTRMGTRGGSSGDT